MAKATTTKRPAETPQERGARQLQELYLLDIGNGDRRLAYYGQKRAIEESHVEAMWSTIDDFGMTRPSASLAAWMAEHPR